MKIQLQELKRIIKEELYKSTLGTGDVSKPEVRLDIIKRYILQRIETLNTRDDPSSKASASELEYILENYLE